MSRIGLVVHGQPPEPVGGVERLLATLAPRLAAAGHVVEVFSGSIAWREHFEVVQDGGAAVPLVRVHRSDLYFERWDKLDHPRVQRAYDEWLVRFAPELVHVHHWTRLASRLVGAASARGIPAVLSLHDYFASCPRFHRVRADDSSCELMPGVDACLRCVPRWSFQGDDEIAASIDAFLAGMRRELEAAAALTVPTAGHGRRLLAWLGMQLEVLTVPPPGSLLTRVATRPLGERVATAGDPLRVGCASHLHPLKGLPLLLDAQAALADPRTVELHVWGEPPTAAIERDLRARAGDRRVVWHGAYEPSDLAAAPVDAMAIPTLCSETYSLTLDEAGSLGVPVLATDLGALAERATGRMLLLPRGDVGAWSAALADLASDPRRRAALRAAPPPDTLDVEEHVARLQRVYADVLARPRPAAPPREATTLEERERDFARRETELQELLRHETSLVAARERATKGP